MKTLFGIFLMTIVFGTAALAQTGGNSPSAVIFSAPKTEDIKEFVSDWGKFKADFAGAPKTQTNPDQPGFAAYYVKGVLSNTSVTVSEFGGDTEKQKDTIYKYVKDSLLKLPQATIVTETDFPAGKYSGKEFTLTYDQARIYTRVRLLPAGKRIYEIKTDVINWHMMNEDKKKEFNTEATRFFDSFKLIEKK